MPRGPTLDAMVVEKDLKLVFYVTRDVRGTK